MSRLSLELGSGVYQHGSYQSVILYEKKRRDLAVATVRDRVVHRLLYDYLVAIYDKTFDPDVWSCRKGRGLYACLQRTQQLLQKYPGGYVWRADVTKFYDNIDHATLQSLTQQKIGNHKNAVDLTSKVINSYSQSEAGRPQGIPIGNLTSQVFSNIYLNELDRFIRHQIKPLAYVRYGDDFAVFCPTRRSAHDIRQLIIGFLSDSLRLTINPKNDAVVASKDGLKFLGHDINRGLVVVDKHTTKSVLSKLDWRNAASYKALWLPETEKIRIDWILLEKDVDIY